MTQPTTQTPATPPIAAPPLAANGAPPVETPAQAPAAPDPQQAANEAVRRARASAAAKHREIETQKRLDAAETRAKEWDKLVELVESEDLVGALEHIGSKLSKFTPPKAVAALKKLSTGDYDSEREKKALLKEVADAKKATADLKESLEAEKQEQVAAKAIQHLYSLAKDEARYPHVAKLPQRIMHREVEEILVAANEESKSPENPKGVWYKFEDALGFLEKQLAGTSSSPVTTDANQQPDSGAASASKTTAAPPRAKTITAGMKSEAPSAPPTNLPRGKARIDHLTAVYDAAKKK